jgi:hypothetical protein
MVAWDKSKGDFVLFSTLMKNETPVRIESA